ncbi:hypothetical protein KM043_000360 [Ampulex compressa]|nr:hypothetical protein KM043_000360 [Ampulex compressa]
MSDDRSEGKEIESSIWSVNYPAGEAGWRVEFGAGTSFRAVENKSGRSMQLKKLLKADTSADVRLARLFRQAIGTYCRRKCLVLSSREKITVFLLDCHRLAAIQFFNELNFGPDPIGAEEAARSIPRKLSNNAKVVSDFDGTYSRYSGLYRTAAVRARANE